MALALITGASSGLGLEFAWQLATARHDLVLTARNEPRLREIAAQISAAAGVSVEVIVADLATDQGIALVAERLAVNDEGSEDALVRDYLRPVGLLVNNAGFGPGQELLSGDLELELDALSVMVKAVLVLSKVAAEQMVLRGRGAILNVGSISALTAGGTYAAAKAWVRTFTEALAVELHGTGVTATVVAPGLTATEFHERADIATEQFPEFAWLDAPRVVTEALADVRRGAVHSTPSGRYKVVSALLRLAPRWLVRSLGRPRL